jgi:hypothetical protein
MHQTNSGQEVLVDGSSHGQSLNALFVEILHTDSEQGGDD